MDEQVTGHMSDEAAAPDESRLAERLIREEFGAPAPGCEETAAAPVVATAATAAGTGIHEEFAEPIRSSQSRSQRTGMLAGLGVVGALLAVLVILSPGSGQPQLPVQSVHDVSPFVASGPKTAAATVLPAAAVPSTTSSTTAPTTPITQPRRNVTVPTTVTYVYQPGTQAPTPTTAAPAPPSTTAPPSPPPPAPTTTTTAPPTTTTTSKPCILGLIC